MKQLDPKSVYLFFFKFVLFTTPLILAIILFVWGSWVSFTNPNISGTVQVIIPYNYWEMILLAVPILLVVYFIWAKLTFYYYRYELTDIGFKRESGVIYKKYVTIPYDRIQNVDIYRGIVARILGLSDLQIQTAGFSASVGRYGVSGAGAEGALPGVSREVAEQLRDELITRATQSRKQGL